MGVGPILQDLQSYSLPETRRLEPRACAALVVDGRSRPSRGPRLKGVPDDDTLKSHDYLEGARSRNPVVVQNPYGMISTNGEEINV